MSGSIKIDAHQHFWQLAQPFCSWPTKAEAALYRDFQPDDLAPHLRRFGVEGTILVQAAPDLEETGYLLRLANETPFVLGVVGWVDLEADNSPKIIELLSEAPLFRGIRPMLQSIDRTDWILSSRFGKPLATLAEKQLTFDALVLPRHLPVIEELARRHTDLTIVVDHAAKPPIGDGSAFATWAKGMAELARQESVFCKLSGLLTEAPEGTEPYAFLPYLDHLYECFGAERLMWGSDWPVLAMAGSYQGWHDLVWDWASRLSEQDRQSIFGGAARRAYRLASLLKMTTE